MPKIPSGYAELQPGEKICFGDKFFPSVGENKRFLSFKQSSKCIGLPYKDVQTPLYQTTVVIRRVKPDEKPKPPEPKPPEELPVINVICKSVPLKYLPKIRELIKANPVFSTRYNIQSINYDYNPACVYVLTNHGGRKDQNYVGVYMHMPNDSTFANCKCVTIEEIISIFDPNFFKHPRFTKDIMMRVKMDIQTLN